MSTGLRQLDLSALFFALMTGSVFLPQLSIAQGSKPTALSQRPGLATANLLLEKSKARPHANTLQRCTSSAIDDLTRGAKSEHLSAALVDLSGDKRHNPDVFLKSPTRTMYAASVAKFGALLAAHQLRHDVNNLAVSEGIKDASKLYARARELWGKDSSSWPIEKVLTPAANTNNQGTFSFSKGFDASLLRMVRNSNNTDASQVIHNLGFSYIAKALSSGGFYDKALGGGLWVGRGFGAPTRTWQRDPVGHHSHAVNTLALASAFTLLGQDRLIDAAASTSLKNYLSDSVWRIKFIEGFERMGLKVNSRSTHLPLTSKVKIWRKSGTMPGISHDAALIERRACLDRRCLRQKDLTYVAVAMADDASVTPLLGRLVMEFDRCIKDNNR